MSVEIKECPTPQGSEYVPSYYPGNGVYYKGNNIYVVYNGTVNAWNLPTPLESIAKSGKAESGGSGPSEDFVLKLIDKVYSLVTYQPERKVRKEDAKTNKT